MEKFLFAEGILSPHDVKYINYEQNIANMIRTLLKICQAIKLCSMLDELLKK
jgi:hypothetical protein